MTMTVKGSAPTVSQMTLSELGARLRPVLEFLNTPKPSDKPALVDFWGKLSQAGPGLKPDKWYADPSGERFLCLNTGTGKPFLLSAKSKVSTNQAIMTGNTHPMRQTPDVVTGQIRALVPTDSGNFARYRCMIINGLPTGMLVTGYVSQSDVREIKE